MAVSLKFLSRSPCKQSLLAASPKVLGSVTPRTPARSPLASGSPFFGSFERSTPIRSPSEDVSALGFGAAPSSASAAASAAAGVGAWRRAAEASVAAQQEVAGAARPFAETAQQHFLARRSLRFGDEVAPPAAPPATLLRQQPKQPLLDGSSSPSASARPSAEGARQHFLARQAQRSGETLTFAESQGPSPCSSSFPTLLRRGQPAAFESAPAPSVSSARAFAEIAREHFLARQSLQQEGGRLPERPCGFEFMGAGLPTLLTDNSAAALGPQLPVLLGCHESAAEEAATSSGPVAGSADVIPSDARALAQMAHQSFLSRQQRMAGRSAAFQVP